MNWLLLKNSLLVSSLTTLLAVSLGLVAALWLAGLPRRWRNGFLALAIIALALPPFLVTNCWLHFLGTTGVWHRWLPLNVISLGGTVWILTLLLWPISLLAILSAWQRLEPAQLESDMAVTGWHLIRGLLVPLARAALAQAAVLTFVLALNNFAVPATLQVKVSPAEMWVRFNTAFDALGALQLSWPLVVGPLLLLVWFARRGIPWPHLQAAVSPGLFRQQLGPAWFRLCGACTLVLCFLSAGLPLLQLCSVQRTWTELPGALAAGQSALWNSFAFATASATAVIALSLLASTWTTSNRPLNRFNPFNLFNSFNQFNPSQPASPHQPKTSLPSFLLWLPFLLPGVLLGIGLITLFNRPWFSLFYQSAGIVILAFVIRYIALGWNTAAHALQTVDPDLSDAARLDGATHWQMFRHVQWPQIAPQIAAAWYIIFLLCLWDVESMILIVPPGGETLALRIFNLLHYGYNTQVNALCLTLLAVALMPLLLWRAWSVVRSPWSVVRGTPPGTGASDQYHAMKPRASLGAQPSGYSKVCAFQTPAFGLRVSAFFRPSAFGFRIYPLLAAGSLILLPGCSPHAPSNQSPIQSQLFTRVQVIGTRGVGVGQLNKPRSVAVDAQDNLYVVDMTGRVQKFSPKGQFLLSWQMPQTDRGKPKGMCRDRDGNVVVIEPHYSRVNHFSPDGKLVAQWGQHGTNSGQLTVPRAVAVSSHGEIFVSEYQEMERVQKFAFEKPATAPQPTNNIASETSSIPRWLAAFGKAGTGAGEFNRPEGLCVDAQDRVYVADSCNHRIQIFSRDGQFIRCYGKPGHGKGELSYPYDICIDAAGRQYVCEFGNSRIQIFDANDHPIEIIGGPGADPGKFSNPWGVALDSKGNLYVADSQNHRVQKFLRSKSVVSSQWSVVGTTSHTTHHAPRTTDYALLTTDYGPRTTDYEQRTPNCGLWTVDCGLNTQ